MIIPYLFHQLFYLLYIGCIDVACGVHMFCYLFQNVSDFGKRSIVFPKLCLAFQMAVDDDVLMKNPFGFELAGVVINDSVTREAITKDQMRKFLKFMHDDNVYYKYYEVVYILFHTGMWTYVNTLDKKS